jgi:DNA-binding NarL/FixJ family response regulator
MVMVDRPKRSVLLVEDQTPVRTLLASSLVSAGFDVTACGSPKEALKVFGQCDPDVLVSDIDLGTRPNGVELATILRAKAPYLALVFITNYPSIRAFERTITPPPRYALLQKDMLDSTDRLMEVIESALSDTDQPRVDTVPLADAPLSRLTAKQLDTVRLMAAGLTNSEIAERRGSTLRAVERAVTRVFEALDLNDDPRQNPRVVATNMFTRVYGYQTLDDNG